MLKSPETVPADDDLNWVDISETEQSLPLLQPPFPLTL